MYAFCIVVARNRYAFLQDDVSSVNLVLQKEGGDACLFVAIDDGPVDGRCASVLGQERRMQVEGAHRGHVPYHFGQHTEGDYNLQIGVQCAQLFQKGLVFQSFGLQNGQILA